MKRLLLLLICSASIVLMAPNPHIKDWAEQETQSDTILGGWNLVDGLQAHFLFDDNKSTVNLVDAGLASLDGELLGGDNTDDISVAGLVTQEGTALDFDGAHAAEINAAQVAMAGDTAGSICLAVKPDAIATNNATLVCFGDTSATELIILQQAPDDGKIAGACFVGGVLQWAFTSDSAVISNGVEAWLVMTQDGVAVKLYVDGVEVPITFSTGPAGDWFADATNIDNGRIAATNFNGGGNANFFDGTIDDVRFYSTALSAADAKALFNQASGTQLEAGTTPLTYAETLGVLSGQADAAFDWNAQSLTNIGTNIDFASAGNVTTGAGLLTLTPTTDVSIANNKGLIVGHTAQIGTDFPTATPELQVLGHGWSDSAILIGDWDSHQQGPRLYFIKSRGVTIGDLTIVAEDDDVGELAFNADDGTDFKSQVARIRVEIDGTPGANDTPGRMVLMTTPDGSPTSLERLRLESSGDVWMASGAVEGHTPSFRVSGFKTGDAFRTCTMDFADVADTFSITGAANYYFDGSVGVKTNDPAASLQVGGGTGQQYIIIDGAAASQVGIQFRKAGSQEWILYQDGSSNDLNLYDVDGAAANVVTFQQGGDTLHAGGITTGTVSNAPSYTNGLSIYGSSSTDSMHLYHNETSGFIEWDDGNLVLQTIEAGNKSSVIQIIGHDAGWGIIDIFDQDNGELLELSCASGIGYMHTEGSSPGVISLQNTAHADVVLFANAASGETASLKIYGHKAGDALRNLSISVGYFVANQVEFTGLGLYNFAGTVISNADYASHRWDRSGVPKWSAINHYAGTDMWSLFDHTGVGVHTLVVEPGSAAEIMRLRSDGNVALADGLTVGKTNTAPAFTNGLSIYGSSSTDQLDIHHDESDAHFKVDDGSFIFTNIGSTNTYTYLDCKGNGTGIGYIRAFDGEDDEYVALTALAGEGHLWVAGDTPGILHIQSPADNYATFFQNSVEGVTHPVLIFGYAAGGAKRNMQIGCGAIADDWGNFTNMSKYYFDDQIIAHTRIGIVTNEPEQLLTIQTGGLAETPVVGIEWTFNNNYESNIGTSFHSTIPVDNYLTFNVCDSSIDGQVTPMKLWGDHKATFGDHATNYAQFSADGTLTFAGTARVKKHVIVSAGTFGTGAASPDESTIGTFAATLFSSVTTEDQTYNFHLPTDYADGTDIGIKVYWCPTTDSAGDTVSWEVDWEARMTADAASGEVLGSGSTNISLHDVTYANANNLQETEEGTIAGGGIESEDVIGIKVYRDHDDADDYAADAAIIYLEIEYTSDKRGE